MVVLVVGAVVGMPLGDARQQVAEGIGKCIDYAASNNVKLAIEPLHPMYAADRSCINRMKEARLVCDYIEGRGDRAAFLEKFGADNMTDIRASYDAYAARLRAARGAAQQHPEREPEVRS